MFPEAEKSLPIINPAEDVVYGTESIHDDDGTRIDEIHKMKVSGLKEALRVCGMSTVGLKMVLVDRLHESVDRGDRILNNLEPRRNSAGGDFPDGSYWRL